MKKVIIALACAIALMVSVNNAPAATINLTQDNVDIYVGSITPANKASETQEVGYINYLITLAPQTGDYSHVDDGQIYNREGSNILVADLPSIAGSYDYKEEEGILDGSWTFNLDDDFYILGKYDADKAGSLVWFVENASFGDVFTLPGSFNGHGLSHLSVYSDGSPVPIPGSLILFGSGLVGLAGIARRRCRA